MANLKSSVKDIRRTKRRTDRNQAQRSRIESGLKAVRAATTKEAAGTALRAVSVLLDRAAHSHLIHWRAAARQKSRLTLYVAAKFKAAPKA